MQGTGTGAELKIASLAPPRKDDTKVLLLLFREDCRPPHCRDGAVSNFHAFVATKLTAVTPIQQHRESLMFGEWCALMLMLMLMLNEMKDER